MLSLLLLPPFPSWPLPGPRCLLGAREPGAAAASPAGCQCATSSTQQGRLFKASLISETIGGWERGKQRLQLASCPVKTAPLSLKNAEGKGKAEMGSGRLTPLLPLPAATPPLHEPLLPVRLVTSKLRQAGSSCRPKARSPSQGPELKF